MRNELASDTSGSLSSLSREVGLAAVAARLHLHFDELELETAEAVKKGVAVLSLARSRPTAFPVRAKARRLRDLRRSNIAIAGR